MAGTDNLTDRSPRGDTRPTVMKTDKLNQDLTWVRAQGAEPISSRRRSFECGSVSSADSFRAFGFSRIYSGVPRRSGRKLGRGG